jgi:hypothetical protein
MLRGSASVVAGMSVILRLGNVVSGIRLNESRYLWFGCRCEAVGCFASEAFAAKIINPKDTKVHQGFRLQIFLRVDVVSFVV